MPLNKDYRIGLDSDLDKIALICNALSSKLRVSILSQIYYKPMSIVELSRANNISNSTTIFHIKVLLDAELIVIKHLPNKKGLTQIFFINFTELNLFFYNKENTLMHQETFTQSVLVGDFIDADFFENYRIVTRMGMIRLTKHSIFDNARKDALLLSTTGGAVIYAFSNEIAEHNKVIDLSFSLELCSEAPNYRNDWQSDITFSINGLEILTYTAPGDYGGIQGKLTPSWWHLNNSQFGDLVKIRINDQGVYLNNQLHTTNINLNRLKLHQKDRITLRIENKKDALHMGGFNIFGKEFGNFDQDIVMSITYEKL